MKSFSIISHEYSFNLLFPVGSARIISSIFFFNMSIFQSSQDASEKEKLLIDEQVIECRN